MSNTKIFASASTGARTKAADTVNSAGGRAYALSTKAALAQMALTGVFNDTFYTKAEDQLAQVKKLAAQVDNEFLAKLAVYARQNGFMKDTPAYFAALLAHRDVQLLAKVFDRVVDNGKMLRNFVQVIRSGQAGRKSLGNRPKKLVANWIRNASDYQLLAASVGNEPSLADVIKLCHVSAKDERQDAMFKYLLGREVENKQMLPDSVQALDVLRKGGAVDSLPNVPFELLTSLNLSDADWESIARNATWQQTRMNLNTFARHGVFKNPKMVDLVAHRLQNRELIAKAKVMPYQLLVAYLNADQSLPMKIKVALQFALEYATENVPSFDESVALLVDTSGSMSNPVTGHRVGATSKVRYIDVASLMASAVLRRNPETYVVPFDTKVHAASLNPMDSIVTNAKKLASYGGGGTACGKALAHLNETGSKAKVVMFISDNESWADNHYYRSDRTVVADEWAKYKKRVKDAKLVCIDITPNTTSQASTRADSLNVGGFSDSVFDVVAKFAQGKTTGDHLVREIEAIEL